MKSEEIHNNGIEGMRVIATFIVITFHLELYVSLFPIKVFSKGWLCVEFFFILSGFLLGRHYGSLKMHEAIYTPALKKYLKFLPAYLFGIYGLVLLYSKAWYSSNIAGWIFDKEHYKALIADTFFLQTTGLFSFQFVNGPDWYIATLIICTLMISILIKLFKWKTIEHLSFFIGIFLYVIMKFRLLSTGIYFKYLSAPLLRGMAGMLVGVGLFWIYERTHTIIEKVNRHLISLLECILLFGFLKVTLVRDSKMSKWDSLIVIISCMIILIMYTRNDGVISQLFIRLKMCDIAKYSYYFYIIQSLCSNIVLTYMAILPSYVLYVNNFILVVLFGYFLWNLDTRIYPRMKILCKEVISAK